MEKILVPTDFSEVASNAAHYALAIARAFNSELLLFHFSDENKGKNAGKLAGEASKLSLAEPFVKINYAESGQHFNQKNIREMISTHHTRLIIMGTVGENAKLSKKLFGSNTAEIIGDIPCPVLAVPPGYTFKDIKKICYASDLSNIDKEVEQVILFAKPFHAEIEILHVSPVFPDLGDVEKIDMEATIRRLKQKYLYPHMSYHVKNMALDNEVNRGVAEFTEYENIDLQVMFHNRQSPFDRLFSSSYTQRTISGLDIPLLVFPKS